MCQYHYSRIQCIIPPYMQSRLLSYRDRELQFFRSRVSQLSLDEQIRAKRKVFTQLSKAGQKAFITKAKAVEAAAVGVYREVYTANHTESLPGTLVRGEGAPAVEDSDVNNVYDAAGATWDFYHALFGRNSIDDDGMKIIQTVHYGQSYANAFWDGEQMIYGDGDQEIFGSFTTDPDIIGHELTHGVVQYESNLIYQGQSGALNESLADVFGIMIKQRILNQTAANSDWLIGENVLLGDQYALRSLKAPGTAYQNHPQLGDDPQPDHMDGYTDDPYDNGGVHLNSGITNHAFYLAATKIGGYAWERTGKVWYAAMCDKEMVTQNADFAAFANATKVHAEKLFAGEPTVGQAVAEAWAAVGIN